MGAAAKKNPFAGTAIASKHGTLRLSHRLQARFRLSALIRATISEENQPLFLVRGIWPSTLDREREREREYQVSNQTLLQPGGPPVSRVNTPASPKIMTTASQDLICPLRLRYLKSPAENLRRVREACTCQQLAVGLRWTTASVGMILWSKLPLWILGPPAIKLSQTKKTQKPLLHAHHCHHRVQNLTAACFAPRES